MDKERNIPKSSNKKFEMYLLSFSISLNTRIVGKISKEINLIGLHAAILRVFIKFLKVIVTSQPFIQPRYPM